MFNDAPVREQCLDSSIERHRAEVDDVDYVMVDNRGEAFQSAGAALNVGALRARHDCLVFVHQDVVLHSLTALERAAAVLDADHGVGLDDAGRALRTVPRPGWHGRSAEPTCRDAPQIAR